MRILLLNQFFYPDTAATSQLLTDLARELAAQGHEVMAVCGKSDYASASDLSPAPNVAILRSRPFPFSRSAVGRIASYASYFTTAAWQSVRGPAPDLILTLTTPPLLSLVGTLTKRLRGAQHIIWEMDLYPDVAVELGVFTQRSLITKITAALANASRKRADRVIALGPDMEERLISQGIPPERVEVVHNWADRSEIRPEPWPTGPLTVYYSGNLGLAHDVATLKQTLSELGSDPAVRFVFAGGGPQRKDLELFCRENGLTQTQFRGYCQRDELSRSLGEGHLGLVTQKPATTGSIVPSKVYGIMAAGRPLLYIGAAHSTPARLIREFNCGWFIEAGDSARLTETLLYLSKRRDLIQEAGARSRRAFLENFDREIALDRLTTILGAKRKSMTTAS